MKNPSTFDEIELIGFSCCVQKAGHPSPFGPFSLLQAPWIDPAYLNLTNLAGFGQFGANLTNQLAGLQCPPTSWTSAAAAAEHHLRRAAAADPFTLIKGTSID